MGSWHACTKRNPVCSSASSLNTAFRFTHGSHHDAQKLRTHAPEATATAASASSAGTKTPPAPAICFGWREEESGHKRINLGARGLLRLGKLLPTTLILPNTDEI